MAFWFPWAVDAVVAAVFVVFFVIGIADGSVSSLNFVLWIAILTVCAGVLGGTLWLRKYGHRGLATLFAWLAAVPGLLAGLFILLVIVLQPRWN